MTNNVFAHRKNISKVNQNLREMTIQFFKWSWEIKASNHSTSDKTTFQE
jgi:hypothetical protein